MTAIERRAALSLAAIFSFRMLGLFMILPVFALYASETFGKVSPVLIGLAIGAYGLANAALQVPFGMLSDRFGCKPVITLGLIIFAVGSVMAAGAHSITGIILGRAVQGAGAVSAAVMALAADLTREEHRTKAMAMIGASIGLSFAFSLAIGPILNHWIGVPGIFWLTALLALAGIALLYLVVPNPVQSRRHRDTGAVPGFFAQVLSDPQLLRLDAGIFALHCILTASFVALPFALRDYARLDTAHHGYVYLPVLLVALALMVPLVIVAEKRRRLKEVFLAAVAGIALAEFGLALFHQGLAAIVASLLLFFIAFNVLEALLPSLIAKFAPADKKGTAMGMYSTAQFLGAFTGGVAGGYLYGHAGVAGVFGFCALAAALWWLWARTMAPPRYLSSYMISMGEALGAGQDIAAQRERELLAQPGVAEAVVVMEEGVAYLKVDSRAVDYAQLNRLAAAWATERAGQTQAST
jgi:MFS family permease